MVGLASPRSLRSLHLSIRLHRLHDVHKKSARVHANVAGGQEEVFHVHAPRDSAHHDMEEDFYDSLRPHTDAVQIRDLLQLRLFL